MRRPVRAGATHGQALVELALVLPVFLLVSLLFIQLCILSVRWWQLNNVASAIARQAAAANGETPAVDNALLRLAAASGLPGDRLWVEFDTEMGSGRSHRIDQAQSGDAPLPAGYSGTVTVHLTYQAPLLFGAFGAAVPLGAAFSEASSGAYGGLAP